MIDIRALGYVRVESTDLERWRHFAGKVLGLVEARGPNPDHLYFRMDEMSARLVVVPGAQDRFGSMGWEVADHRALAAAVDHLKHHGVEVQDATAEELGHGHVHGPGDAELFLQWGEALYKDRRWEALLIGLWRHLLHSRFQLWPISWEAGTHS